MDAHADPDAIIIRRLLPGDAPAACALFAAGMMETIEGGLRSAALRPSLGAGLGALALAAAHVFATRRGGVAPSTAHAAAAAAVGAAVISAGWALPRSFASAYVEKSLASDMADPVAHYGAARGAFWVAVDATLGTVRRLLFSQNPQGVRTHTRVCTAARRAYRRGENGCGIVIVLLSLPSEGACGVRGTGRAKVGPVLMPRQWPEAL